MTTNIENTSKLPTKIQIRVGRVEASPSKQTQQSIFMDRENIQAKQTTKSWKRKDTKDLPSLSPCILLSLGKVPIPQEPPRQHPPEEPPLPSAGGCTPVGQARGAGGVSGLRLLLSSVSSASQGTCSHLIVMLGEAVVKIFYYRLTVST